MPQCSYENNENFYYNMIDIDKNVDYCNLPINLKRNSFNENDDDETQFMNITDKIYENLKFFDAKQQPTSSTTTKTTNSSNGTTTSTSSGVSSSNRSSNDGCFGGDEPELYGI